MCKVYEFPVKKTIPKEVEEIVQDAAKNYVKVINETLEYLVDDDTTEEEYDELTTMLLDIYVKAIIEAVEEYE